LGSGTGGAVSALAVLHNGDLVAGGGFLTAGGVAANNIARWNGSSWSAMGVTAGNALTVLPGGDLVAGVSFTSNGTSYSGLGRYTAVANFAAPEITQQPTNQQVVGGFNASFSVAANDQGNPPLTYQWRRNGAPLVNGNGLSGVTTATLSFSPARLTDAGLYDVLVSSPACSGGTLVTVSRTATLSVTDPCINNPSVTQAPVPALACPSGVASFSVTAAGSSPITYRWQRETSPGTFVNLSNGRTTWDGCGGTGVIFGSATRSLVITADTAGGLRLCSGHAVRYRCIITNSCGSSASESATLTLAQSCSVADIVGTGSGPTDCGDANVDGSDFIAFINSFGIGDATVDPLADVAGGGDDGLEPDGTIDGGDFIAFINAFSIGC
jgi:hypothetical protein